MKMRLESHSLPVTAKDHCTFHKKRLMVPVTLRSLERDKGFPYRSFVLFDLCSGECPASSLAGKAASVPHFSLPMSVRGEVTEAGSGLAVEPLDQGQPWMLVL